MMILFGIVILLCALLGTPLFVIIGALALFFFYSVGIDTSAVVVEMYRMASSPTLLAIPLFTFTGFVLAKSNTSKRLINLSGALFGWLPGGLAVVALVTCAFFTAFTGASGVTIIALGGLLYPMLVSEKYPKKFSLGLMTASGSLGLLFPPSLPLILYGMVSQTSVDQLFLAGIIPGIILILILSGYSIRWGFAAQVKKTPFSFKEISKALKEMAWEIPLPMIILGGIYGGIFTATEAAAVTAVYVVVIECFIYREIRFARDVPRIMKESMVLVGGILIILGAALGLTSYLIDQQVPMKILALMKTYISSKYTFLILLNILLLIVGCMMDIFSAIMVVVPLITPIATSFGVDPIHLGIIFLTNLEIGYSTPPVGLNLFIASSRFKEPVVKLYGAALPFLGLRLIALILITYVPFISLWLVELLQVR
ncbi:TRAP transporter large permease subunit [candidate division KSB1 bacterium]|nr:TRAP transporter large permease subunit [candidate division KSB1 bacterium]